MWFFFSFLFFLFINVGGIIKQADSHDNDRGNHIFGNSQSAFCFEGSWTRTVGISGRISSSLNCDFVDIDSLCSIRGCILIIGLGIIATYTGYVLGQFKLRYVCNP